MSATTHTCAASIEGTGNRGTGMSGYPAGGRDHVIRMDGNPDSAGASEPAFRGDRTLRNPEELLLAALSTWHMHWYLH